MTLAEYADTVNHYRKLAEKHPAGTSKLTTGKRQILQNYITVPARGLWRPCVFIYTNNESLEIITNSQGWIS